MLITVLRQPGNHHHNHSDHLVFVLINSEAHGVERIDPEYYTCECGATLTPEVLDDGDESKTSWPNCKSWRNGDRKKCPHCDEYPTIGREQHIRARGIVPLPKDQIKPVTESQRQAALEKYDGNCVVCDESASYVKRIVPPRFGGNQGVGEPCSGPRPPMKDYGWTGEPDITHLERVTGDYILEILPSEFVSRNERGKGGLVPPDCSPRPGI